MAVAPRTPPNPRTPSWLLAACALGAALLGFGRLLPAYFVGDDFAFIGRYATFPFSEWPGLFTRSWQAGLFSVDLREIRPLNALAFILDARLWGAEPFGFRLTNLLLHAGCAALVGALAWELTRVRRVALFALAVFAFHPVTVPAVAWITGRVDALATLFTLGAVRALVRFRGREDSGTGSLAALAFCFAAALFTKESALVFPGLMLAVDFALGARWRDASTWRPYLAAAAVLTVYGACRYVAFGAAGPETVGRGLPSLLSPGVLQELAGRQVRYVAHLFPPAAEWLARWRDAGFPRHGFEFFRVVAIGLVAGTAAAAAILWLSRARAPTFRRRVLGLGVGWYLCTTLPLILTYFSARHLYPASAGLALVAALTMHELLPSRRRFVVAAAACVLIATILQQMALTPWRRAADSSRAFAHAVQAAARDNAPGTLVLIDAPDLVDGAFCWSWAVPHALRPPFAPAPLATRIVPLARPAACAFQQQWRAQLPWTALEENTRPARLLRLRADGTVEDGIVTAAQLSRAAAVLRTAPHGDDDAAWATLIAMLRDQASP